MVRHTGKVLVTGATGNVGSRLVPELKSAGVDVLVFVRDKGKAHPLRELGVKVFVGDLNRYETIAPAVEDVDKIYLLTWNGEDQARQAENVIKAAIQTGRKPHIIRQSMWGPEGSRIMQKMRHIEKIIQYSGLPWTLLKPAFFMQNLLLAAQAISTRGMLSWDMGRGKLSMIDMQDLVDAAFAVLTEGGHEDQNYILTGPEAISFHKVANILSKVLDRKVTYESIPPDLAMKNRCHLGFPEWVAMGYGELMEGFRANFADRVTDGVEVLTGHPARRFDQFALEFAHWFSVYSRWLNDSTPKPLIRFSVL